MATNLQAEYSHGEVLKSLETADFIFTENIYPGINNLPEHSHENAHFCFVLQGSYTEYHGKKEIKCQPYTLNFLPSGEVHKDCFYGRGIRVFIIEILPQRIENLLNYSLKLNRAVNFQNGLLPHLTTRLNGEFHRMDDSSPLVIEGLMLEMLGETARASVGDLEQKLPRWLERAREYVRVHFSENLTLDRIASEVGVHPVHLASVFRRKYGCTVGEYIRQLKIEFACREMTRGEKPLATIALDAGFASQSHFSSLFKRFTGFTPAAYKKSFRQS